MNLVSKRDIELYLTLGGKLDTAEDIVRLANHFVQHGINEISAILKKNLDEGHSLIYNRTYSMSNNKEVAHEQWEIVDEYLDTILSAKSMEEWL
jgi:hypothetical protein